MLNVQKTVIKLQTLIAKLIGYTKLSQIIRLDINFFYNNVETGIFR